MSKRSSGPSRIVAAASGGFLAAIGMAIVVWSFPTVIHFRAVSDDGGEGLFESRPSPLASPPPVAKPPIPSSTTTPTIAADPLPELRDRQLELPLRGAVRQELRDSFYKTRGSSHSHEAIDIMAPRNTPILAVEDGTIARLFESKAGGTTVYQLDPSTKYVYYYAHLERYADGLQEGHHVQRGQVLGYVGTSGNAPKDSPHLHFAIFRLTEKKQWWQGTPIDPYEVLK
jgi:murein DD-endopeptidase MepM/ murein hydrolase activator NlpD